MKIKSYPKIVIKKGKESSILRFHPWVFSGAIMKKDEELADGSIVEIYDSSSNYLATGHYQNSTIAVRIISFDKTEIDSDFWFKKIDSAYQYRCSIGIIDNAETNVYRLIHAEGDGLPGLIIDMYNNVAVIQCHSIGMHKNLEEIKQALIGVFKDQLSGIYDKSNESLPANLKNNIQNSFIYQNGTIENRVIENGNAFYIDFVKGQKTGFFIDQRDNRKLLQHYAKGKTILNTFCYTGGFSVAALKGGANMVYSIDSSKQAIELTRNNLELNGFDTEKNQCLVKETLDFLKSNEQKWDIIVLDPPAYAKHLDAKQNAIQGYKRLNLEALNRINDGGILFTFSCSQVIGRQLFESTFVSAAILAKRKIRILHHLSQPADHPINVFHPEGEYLKGLVVFVE